MKFEKVCKLWNIISSNLFSFFVCFAPLGMPLTLILEHLKLFHNFVFLSLTFSVSLCLCVSFGEKRHTHFHSLILYYCLFNSFVLVHFYFWTIKFNNHFISKVYSNSHHILCILNFKYWSLLVYYFNLFFLSFISLFNRFIFLVSGKYGIKLILNVITY